MRAAALLLLAAAASATQDHDKDFEFDDNTDASARGHARRPRRYVYDPNNALCSGVACEAHSVCAVWRGARALCVPKDKVTPPIPDREPDLPEPGADNTISEDDVWYDRREDELDAESRPTRCVGCGSNNAGVSGGFLCGSDNRTYSSLCRLDLHNCVRRARPPVTLACRGFCPCEKARARAKPRRTQRRKHDKYRQYVHDTSRRHRVEMNHNEVLPVKEKAQLDNEGAGCEMDSMASRLLDWFNVLMEQARAVPPPEDGSFPEGCLPEVRWMFSHLDTDGDGLLSADNLYALRHDDRERCLRPFLSRCGDGAGVSRAAWCGCLRRADRPCATLARQHPPQPGAYVPRCDAQGFYLPRQCHSALRVCWCVDTHGQERPGSRTRGKAHCPGEDGPAEELGAPTDDEDAAAGSGDSELLY
ncbi:proteoglycan Cow [Plutella xylostella]|uniref:proteoglycan Cow n=1 Tax=Plutella xylostella TaxID=51655 RepID=UPI002032869C|nr:proteoglycan Cow [Plutella xylostella]